MQLTPLTILLEKSGEDIICTIFDFDNAEEENTVIETRIVHITCTDDLAHIPDDYDCDIEFHTRHDPIMQDIGDDLDLRTTLKSIAYRL